MKKLPGLFLLFLLFGSLIFAFHYALYFFIEKQGGFEIKSVTVSGLHYLSEDEVIALSGLKKARNIFDVDLMNTAVSISTHPMIRYAVVRRNPPNEILVNVTEVKPIASLQISGTNAFVGGEGELIFRNLNLTLPSLVLDYTPTIKNGVIDDSVVLLLLSRLERYRGNEKIDMVSFKREEGVYVVFHALPNTLFYLGRSLAGRLAFQKAAGIVKQIREKHLKLKYVDINRDNAIGVVD